MKTPWDTFFEEKMVKMFTEKKSILDIGGGLRILREKNNRFDAKRAWLIPYAEKIAYKVMDPVSDYHPDVVGDIHAIPFKDDSQEAIICMAVLEHVENPFIAMKEMYRVLQPGGYCFIYVPFLYYYHPEIGYYADYWRFTQDALKMLSKDFKTVEIQPVRGAIGTWIRLSPLGRFAALQWLATAADKITGKINSKQVSGFNVFLIK
ncbi:MAG TPA: methyltransferase domain-containing protein [Candidatus Paceibacterota bacterium]|jgi:ubiquinone/menaquinone biosynthesis C-methylase UbiE|nr:methyltransferase domain-containing protein [Candidatus Paceibacterota bacterium]